MPASLTIRALARIDDGFNWLTNQVLRHPDQASIEHIILKTYFQIFLLFGTLLFCARLLARRLPPDPQHPYTRLSTLVDHHQRLESETNVDVYLDLPLSPCLPLDQLLHLLRSLVHDHRPALGLWDRTPKLELHFYQPQPHDNRLAHELSEKELVKSSSKAYPSPLGLQHPSLPNQDRYVAVKPLLADLLEAATQTEAHGGILLISTDDQELVQYGVRLLQLLPDPPLICYVTPIGSELPLELARAADVVFGWCGHQFELIPISSHDAADEDGDDHGLETDPRLIIFRPLVLLLRAHGPVGLAQVCVSQLEGLLDGPHSSSHFLSGHTFRQYIRLALSMGVVGVSTTSTVDVDLVADLEGSALIYLQPPTQNLIQQTSEYPSEPVSPSQVTLPSPPPVANTLFEPVQLLVESTEKADQDPGTSSESERVTNSHRSSYAQLPVEPEPRPTLKHAPSDTGLEPAKCKKRRPPAASVSHRPARHTAKVVHRRRRPRAKSLIEPPCISQHDSVITLQPFISPPPVSTPQLSPERQPVPIEPSPVPVHATTPITSSPQLPSPNQNPSSPEPSPRPVYAAVTPAASPTTERRSFDLERGTPPTPGGLWIRSWSRASGLIERHEPFSPFQGILRPKTFSPLQEILRPKTFFVSSAPRLNRGLEVDNWSIELGRPLLDAEEDLEMEID